MSEKDDSKRERIHINYLFDPLCGWCYGAAPVLERLSEYEEFAIELTPTGLFADENSRVMSKSFAEFAWSNDQRIAGLTGQDFSADYKDKVLCDYRQPFDSGPATRALTAVATTAAAFELIALKAFQRARYVEGQDITRSDILVEILSTLDLVEATSAFLESSEVLVTSSQKRVERGQSMLTDLGGRGVPALVVVRDGAACLLTTDKLFGHFDALLAHLREVSYP